MRGFNQILDFVDWVQNDDERIWKGLAFLLPFSLIYLVYPHDVELSKYLFAFYFLIFWLFYSNYWERKLKMTMKVNDSVKEVIEVNETRFKKMKIKLDEISKDYNKLPGIPRFNKALASFTEKIVEHNITNGKFEVEKIVERRDKKSINRFVVAVSLSFLLFYFFLYKEGLNPFLSSLIFLSIFIVLLLIDYVWTYKNLIALKFLSGILDLMLDKLPDRFLDRIIEENKKRWKNLQSKT